MLSQGSRCCMSSEHGSPLTTELLLDIARPLSVLDKRIWEWVANVNQNMLQTDPQAQEQLVEIADLNRQYNDVSSGRRYFHKDYLADRHLLPYWTQTERFVAYLLAQQAASSIHEQLKHDMTAMEQKARELGDGLRERMLPTSCRTMPGWPYGRSGPETAARMPAKAPSPQASAQGSSATSKLTPGRFSFLLWAVYALIVLVTIPTFVKAYLCSAHTPGTTSDADFWFLVQSSATQLFGLAFGTAPIKSSKGGPLLWWLVPTLLAGVTTCLAPVLYVTVPTEWSSYCLLTGAAVQAFMLLQIASLET
ncbi:hypothetical protein B0A55_11604 [Friedmanniomyces simplex]|uniref:Uncharacterized protein n=1 Tax=Friedmanniomyces simplex TaxID=329884 RepID=A0A4U0W8Y0_9PEZI|nr:hypothetical protein B0A55_11604 [Friedmanniomyces simplex]